MSNLNNIRGSGERVRKTTGQQVWIPELSETEERLLKKREFLKEKINQELLFAKKNSRANRKCEIFERKVCFFYKTARQVKKNQKMAALASEETS
uniref:Uncharacterized protein n=1 Tax=Acanthochromis polyacanthus TaxID=80966 RepID=A0A3Q1G9S5_9TELE